MTEPLAESIETPPVDDRNEPLDYDDNEQVTITSYDGQDFTITIGAARYSKTLRSLIQDAGIENPIPLPNENATGAVLTRLVAFMNHYADNPRTEDPNTYSGEDREVTNTKLSDFDKTWISYDSVWTQQDYDFASTCLEAVDYLDARDILHVLTQVMCDKLTNRTPEELIALFKMRPEDLPTAEERAEIEKRYAFLKAD